MMVNAITKKLKCGKLGARYKWNSSLDITAYLLHFIPSSHPLFIQQAFIRLVLGVHKIIGSQKAWTLPFVSIQMSKGHRLNLIFCLWKTISIKVPNSWNRLTRWPWSCTTLNTTMQSIHTHQQIHFPKRIKHPRAAQHGQHGCSRRDRCRCQRRVLLCCRPSCLLTHALKEDFELRMFLIHLNKHLWDTCATL